MSEINGVPALPEPKHTVSIARLRLHTQITVNYNEPDHEYYGLTTTITIANDKTIDCPGVTRRPFPIDATREELTIFALWAIPLMMKRRETKD